jgi:VanZ family protein
MSRRLPKYVLLALALYWAAMFIATHIPGTSLPKPSLGLDKVVHFVGYAALAWLAALALRAMGYLNWKTVIAVVVVAAIYGAIDELLQPYFNRVCDLNDWLADVAGAIFGLIAFAMSWPLIARWRRARRGAIAPRPPAAS